MSELREALDAAGVTNTAELAEALGHFQDQPEQNLPSSDAYDSPIILTASSERQLRTVHEKILTWTIAGVIIAAIAALILIVTIVAA